MRITLRVNGLGGSDNIRSPSQEEMSSWVVSQTLVTSLPLHKFFVTSVKDRWKGKKLLDIYSAEFPSRSRKYYECIAQNGLLYATSFCHSKRLRKRSGEVEKNQYNWPSDRPLEDSAEPQPHELNASFEGNECVVHECLVSEAIVIDQPVKTVYIDPDEKFLVVSKPAGIPCYPQGAFERNTLASRLKETLSAMGHAESTALSFMSRLDRVTSGLIGVALNNAEEMISSFRKWSKFYLAEIEGAWGFAENQFVHRIDDMTIMVDAPLERLQHEPGSMLRVGVNPDMGKASKSVFIYLCESKDSKTSLVLAIPVTGRTHQLRCHVQHMGSRIVHDPLYGSSAVSMSQENHQYFFVLRYTEATSERILDEIPSICSLLASLDESTLTPVDFDGMGGSYVEEVFLASRNVMECFKSAASISDVALSKDDQKKILSIHPFVSPWKIHLHAFAYKSASGQTCQDEEKIISGELPDWVRDKFDVEYAKVMSVITKEKKIL